MFIFVSFSIDTLITECYPK